MENIFQNGTYDQSFSPRWFIYKPWYGTTIYVHCFSFNFKLHLCTLGWTKHHGTHAQRWKYSGILVDIFQFEWRFHSSTFRCSKMALHSLLYQIVLLDSSTAYLAIVGETLGDPALVIYIQKSYGMQQPVSKLWWLKNSSHCFAHSSFCSVSIPNVYLNKMWLSAFWLRTWLCISWSWFTINRHTSNR